jgi:hypothetical protein
LVGVRILEGYQLDAAEMQRLRASVDIIGGASAGV